VTCRTLRIREARRYLDAVLQEVRQSLAEVFALAVAPEVFQVRANDGGTLPHDAREDRSLVIWLRLPRFDRDRALGAVPDAGAETVAEKIADEARLAVDYPDRPFGAVRDAESAPGASLLVDSYDLALQSSTSARRVTASPDRTSAPYPDRLFGIIIPQC
jgi:hypothetical protein